MKKILALVLALMMAASFTGAFAATVPYEHPVLGYSFECPEGWYILDVATMESIFDAPETAALFPNVDLESFKAQISQSNMAMFVAPDGMSNFNIGGVNLGMPFSANDLVTMILPSMVEQYNAIMPGVEIIEPGCVENFSGKEYACLMYGFQSGETLTVGIQFFTCETGTLYTVTFTTTVYADDITTFEANAAVFNQIMESFVIK